MPIISKTALERVVKHYIKEGDLEGAKNHVKSFGEQLNNYDVDAELEKIDKLIEKSKKEDKEE